MSCLCATTTLKLFVRSVAQLEIGTGTRSAARSSSASVRQWRQRGGYNNNVVTLGRAGRAAFAQLRGFSSIPPRREEGEKNDNGTGKEAVAEISVENIEDLVAELESETSPTGVYGDMSGFEGAQGREGSERQPRARQRKQAEHPSRKPEFETSESENKNTTKLPSDKSESRQTDKGYTTKDKERTTDKESRPRKDDWTPPPRQHWQIDKDALKAKFPEGWSPLRRLSPDALAGIRALHAQMPTEFTTMALANRFKVSPEAIRRILKSKWSPNAEEETDRARRWIKRGKKVYERHVAEGGKAPKRWREMGVGVGAGKRARERGRMKRESAAREWEERGKRPLPALVTKKRDRQGFGKGREGGGLEGRIL